MGVPYFQEEIAAWLMDRAANEKLTFSERLVLEHFAGLVGSGDWRTIGRKCTADKWPTGVAKQEWEHGRCRLWHGHTGDHMTVSVDGVVVEWERVLPF